MSEVRKRIRDLHTTPNNGFSYNWGNQDKVAENGDSPDSDSGGFSLDDVKESILGWTGENPWVVPGAIGGGALGLLSGLGGNFNSPSGLLKSLLGRTGAGAAMGGAAGWAAPQAAAYLSNLGKGRDESDKSEEPQSADERKEADEAAADAYVEGNSVEEKLHRYADKQGLDLNDADAIRNSVTNNSKLTQEQKQEAYSELRSRAGGLRLSDIGTTTYVPRKLWGAGKAGTGYMGDAIGWLGSIGTGGDWLEEDEDGKTVYNIYSNKGINSIERAVNKTYDNGEGNAGALDILRTYTNASNPHTLRQTINTLNIDPDRKNSLLGIIGRSLWQSESKDKLREALTSGQEEEIRNEGMVNEQFNIFDEIKNQSE